MPSRGTRKVYKYGLNKFLEWYGKTGKEVLEERKDDLTPIDDVDGGYLAQRFFDLYYSGAKKDEGENLDLGNFEFLTKEFIVNTDGDTVNFSDLYLDWTLYDLGSNIALPALIPHPSIEVARVNMDAPGVFIENVTTSGFDISRITGWTHDDVKVQLLIKGG